LRVFLVRHAEAAPGEPDAERALTEAGRATADALGLRLAAERPAAVISSPLLRARETAAAIARAAALQPEVDDRLAPGATAALLREAATGRGETVVAVGHQPDCSKIVLAVTGRRVSFGPGAYRELTL
jgi:phosphohistidine phosphatase